MKKYKDYNMLNEKGAKTMECFVEKYNTIYYSNIPNGVLVPLGTHKIDSYYINIKE